MKTLFSKLRVNLLLLALTPLVPLVLLAVGAGLFLVQHQRETMQREAIGRVRSMLSALDESMQGSLAAARALTVSKDLEQGDLRAFHEQCRRVLRSQPNWLNVGLASAAGTQLLNAVLPFGEHKPQIGDPESFERVVRTGKAAFGSVAVGPAIHAPTVRIRMPVVIDGAVRYVLSVSLRLEAFAALLEAQGFPPGWAVGIVDHNKRFIARIPAIPPGTSVSESFRAALERAPEGWFRGRTLEGVEIYTPYATSSVSGWHIGFAIPAPEIEGPARSTFRMLTLGTAGALAVALWLAWLLGRRIEQPISALSAAAADLRLGNDVEMPRLSSIDKMKDLGEAFAAARAAMLERQALLEREKAMLQETDRAKDEFIAMLSHELRNPLAAITSAAQVLKLVPPGADSASKARAVIERQTTHMARLVEDLLDVSSITMGKATLAREPLDLAAAVGSATEALKAADRFANHRIMLDLQPVWVHADRARLEQILVNLLDNAVKFTPAGKRVFLSVRREHGRAVLRVSDEGEGLEAHLANRVFDLFVQGERGLDRKQGGLGVGLALVRRLVEMHGGNVSVSSEGPGKGAEFTVSFPAISAPTQTIDVEAERRSEPRGGRRILVVEDNDDVRQTLRVMLTTNGHLVHEARDGESGVALAARTKPEIALIDIGLPGMDGYEVAKRLRQSDQQWLALIALTGYGQPEDERRAREAGFDVHLVKPVPPQRLEETIRALS